jgi:hypothetical protein
MPDTGLPWEIPYAAPADIVRDWPALSEDVADAVAAGLTAANISVSQVTATTNFTTTSTSLVNVTGATFTITPKAATNRFLMMFAANYTNSNGSNKCFWRFRRDSTDLFEEVTGRITSGNQEFVMSMMFDEEASSTTARDYLAMMRVDGATGTLFNSSFIVIEYTP